MSWHTNGVFIRADYSADYPALLDKLGLRGAIEADEIEFDDATAGDNDGVAIGTVGGWTVLWGNIALFGIDPKGVAELSKNSPIFQLMLEGASDTAGFEWWSGGERLRNWLYQDGEVLRDEGTPLPEEKKAFAKRDEEQAVLKLMAALTVPFDKLEAAEYRMYEIAED